MIPALIIATHIALRLFTVEASSSIKYSVDIPIERIKAYGDDIGLLSRNMPGVTAIQQIAPNRYLYKTRKSVPLSSDMKLDFTIERSLSGETTVYESVQPNDPNYMRCAVRLVPLGESRTGFEISLRLRLQREDASDVHWLAPIVGEKFLSEQMSDDMKEMLEEFKQRASAELYNKLGRGTGRQ
ncbi:MAG: SRPBCC family protein [Ignavibacteriae bacterium]|nr:SRPBCC family protein [Ignavibacteriota bacterium]